MSTELAITPPAVAPIAQPVIEAQKQQVLAAHQARLLATKRSLNSPMGSRTSINRLDTGKRGSIQKKRKQGNIRLSDKVRALIPSSALLFELQTVEQRVDEVLARKKGELQDMQASFRRGVPGSASAAGTVRRRLRIYAFTEHFHQPPGEGDPAAAPGPDPPSWALHIQGRLLTVGDGPSGVGAVAPAGRQPFTQYIERLRVRLDPELYPGSAGDVAWERARHDQTDKDSIVVRRAGSTPTKATVSIEVNHSPPLYRPSSKLAALLGLEGLHSLPYIMQMLWGYIKHHQLFEATPQSPVVRCDEALQRVTGRSTVELTALQDAVRVSVTPAEPVVLEIPIPLSGPSPSHPQCYDVLTEVPLNAALPQWAGPDSAAAAEIEACDAALATVVEAAGEAARRRAFLLGFASSPVDAIDHLIAAQARDIRVAAGGDALEVLPPSHVHSELWVQDAALRVMNAAGAK